MAKLRVHNFAISLDGYGAGERLFDNLDGVDDLYQSAEVASSPRIAHVVLTRLIKTSG